MATRTDFAGNARRPRQRISVDEGLTAATIKGAYASHEEAAEGTTTAAGLADFITLVRDAHRASPGGIKNIQGVRTVVGGRTVHPKGDA
jgi:predicted amidohydrolase YtcJ